MSSANLVSIVYEREAEYGVRADPSAGSTLETARFTSESLSGTPQTTTSAELRIDRMSAGQVVTGLDVNGDISFELSPDKFFDDFFESGMLSTWIPEELINTTVDIVPDGTDPQLAVMTLGAEFVNLTPGTLCTIDAAGGSVIVSIISVDTPSTVFSVATVRDQPAISETADVAIPSYVDIGSTVDGNSFLVGKSYKDVQHLATTDDHSQTYTGEMVAGFSIDAAYGSIITGNYSMLGNGYLQEFPSYEQLVETAGGTVNPAGTTNPINASIDIPLITVAGVSTDFCTESFSLSLDNGLEAQNCIGKAAPQNYTLGTANITVNMSVYLSDSSYDALMLKKITQEPVSMTYVAENLEGGYAFAMPAIQLSFPDGAATGQNEQVMLEASGVAKVGDGGASALRIYKL